ncbi:MAG: tRNA (adenosine(37)-N6)-dimethylallyltransferase MiaA [Acidobacteria bacterium 37-65-4]|nr:MAG: tRNA (adenosine(37)-N6)-dimethylallyltransferase MiaA [Acidobacteria bacterium 37-65-4]
MWRSVENGSDPVLRAPVLLAIVGPTATGKSAMAIDLAARLGGEVVACDSTAVYRGIDIGTDKVSLEEQRGIAHHLVDMVDATETYSAARYAADAAAAVHDIYRRGKVPILAGGTGFYYRALVRGLFPGPARDEILRQRLNRVATRRGVEALHRWLQGIDPESAARIQPRDQKRLVRALEVYVLTGRPLTAHFAATVSPLAGWTIRTFGLNVPRDTLRARVTARVEQQFERGVVDEVRRLIASGVPATAHAFSGLVYRQVIEMLHGVRNEADTRALIVQENMRYAKRQLTWFRRGQCIRWSSADAIESISGVCGFSRPPQP